MKDQVHHSAAAGYKTGADTYVRGRPNYPRFPHPAFGPLAEQRFSHGHTGSPEDVIFNRVRSTSFVAALPTVERAKVDEQIRALIEAEPDLRGRDVLTVPYVTAAFVAVKSS